MICSAARRAWARIFSASRCASAIARSAALLDARVALRYARHPGRAWPSMPRLELAILRQGSGIPDRGLAHCHGGLRPHGWAVSYRLVMLAPTAAPPARSLAAARGVRPAPIGTLLTAASAPGDGRNQY